MSAREAERVLMAELVDELRHQAATQTALAATLAGNIINDVLRVETAAFPSTGYIAREFHVAAGCVQIENLSVAGVVTVSSAGPGSVPTTGTGTYPVPAASHRVVALASRQLTLYGTPGDTVAFQVFSGAPRPVVD